ncbi:MAG: DUF1338 domain-containing protein [Chitinophagaceae bacterium]
MNKHTTKNLSIILEGLLSKYRERVPEYGLVMNALMNEGVISSASEIENDHIAFRTLAVPHLGIASLEKIFLYYGYRKMDYYNFPEKKLNAYWYATPSEEFPRIFLSELRVNQLSEDSREIIHQYTDVVNADPVDAFDPDDVATVTNYLHSSSWSLPSIGDYEALSAESEYAAWAIYNRYYLNHFTIAVHNFKDGYNTLADFNLFLERHGIILNDSGGKIKRSPDGYLLQSSTVASMVNGVFAANRRKMIPGSYVEFAERRVLPEFARIPSDQISHIHRREGFEAGNADKIFESTYMDQVGKGRNKS